MYPIQNSYEPLYAYLSKILTWEFSEPLK